MSSVQKDTIGVSRQTAYRRHNPEKAKEQRARDNEARKSKDDYLVNTRDGCAMSIRRRNTVGRYHEMTTNNPDMLWDDVITDLENNKDAKTRVGTKKYTTVDDFEFYISKSVYRKKCGDVEKLAGLYFKWVENGKIPSNIKIIKNDEEAKEHRNLGFYVYMITYPDGEKVKIGRHTGHLLSLRTRYNTHTCGEYTIYAYETPDNIKLEKHLHLTLKKKDLHSVREFFIDTKETRGVFFNTGA